MNALTILTHNSSQKPVFIDIIIPIFNSSASLLLTVKSVINQSYRHWKCYLVDDGSTDDTVSIAKDLSKQDERITVLSRSEGKKGANTCRNLGWKKSTSDYIIFMDADDLLLKDCLKNRAMIVQDHPAADLLIFQTEVVNERGSFLRKFPCCERETVDLIRLFIEHKIQWQTMSPVWKRSFLSKIGGWNENYVRLQDVELNIRALLHEPLIKFFPGKPDTQYKFVELNLSKTQAALYGIQRLIEDYFNLFIHGEAFDNRTALQFKEAFVALAFIAVQLFDSSIYTMSTNWQEDFLLTIKSLKLNKEHAIIKNRLKRISSRKIPINHPSDFETWQPGNNKKDKILFTVILFADNIHDLDRSLKSLENQTLLNFEVFVLLNQDPLDFKVSFSKNIKIQHLETGKTLLPETINQANGTYIFLLDCKYTLAENCLNMHFRYLNNRRDVGCTGSLGISINSNTNTTVVLNEIATSTSIKVALLKENRFLSGPICMRRSLLLKHIILMDEEHLANENFKLLVVLSKHTKTAVLPRNLFTRHHQKDTFQRPDLLNPTRIHQLNLLCAHYPEEDLNLHLKAMSGKILQKEEIRKYLIWANELLSQNEVKKVFSQKVLYRFFDNEIRSLFDRIGN